MVLSKEIIRLATPTDLPPIMEGIKGAKKQLKKHKSGQWQNGEPSIKTIKKDIEIGQYFVLAVDGVITAGCALLFFEDAYTNLNKGAWLNEDPYGVVHRFYVHPSFQRKGYAVKLLQGIENHLLQLGIHNCRIDTHERNLPMRRTLEKLNYIEVGEASLPLAGLRLVYHKCI